MVAGGAGPGVRLAVRVVHAYALTALLASGLFAVMGYRWPTMALSTVLWVLVVQRRVAHRARVVARGWTERWLAWRRAWWLAPAIAVMARRILRCPGTWPTCLWRGCCSPCLRLRPGRPVDSNDDGPSWCIWCWPPGPRWVSSFPLPPHRWGPWCWPRFCAWLLLVVVEAGWSLWWCVLWSALPAGLLAAVFVPQLQHHNWRMAGLHAITLGPDLLCSGWFVFKLRPPWVVLAGYLVAVVGMNTALVLDVADAPVWVALFSTATALGVGTGVVHHQARQHFPRFQQSDGCVLPRCRRGKPGSASLALPKDFLLNI